MTDEPLIPWREISALSLDRAEALEAERDELRAQIEQLKEEVEMWQQHYHRVLTELAAVKGDPQATAEHSSVIERLRAELEVERTAEKMQRDKAIANYAEVRQLRADLEAERSDKIRQMDISNQQLGDEVEEGERLRAAAVSVVAAYGRWEIVSRDGGVNDADDAWYAVGDAIEHDLAPLVP